MATIAGKAVNFGFGAIEGIAETTYFTGKILLQSADYENTSDEDQVRDAAGNVVARGFYNPGAKATLEYIPYGATIAGATGNTTLPAVSTFVSITGCSHLPALVDTKWVVVAGGKITKSNTGAARISLPIESLAGITGIAA